MSGLRVPIRPSTDQCDSFLVKVPEWAFSDPFLLVFSPLAPLLGVISPQKRCEPFSGAHIFVASGDTLLGSYARPAAPWALEVEPVYPIYDEAEIDRLFCPRLFVKVLLTRGC